MPTGSIGGSTDSQNRNLQMEHSKKIIKDLQSRITNHKSHKISARAVSSHQTHDHSISFDPTVSNFDPFLGIKMASNKKYFDFYINFIRNSNYIGENLYMPS